MPRSNLDEERLYPGGDGRKQTAGPLHTLDSIHLYIHYDNFLANERKMFCAKKQSIVTVCHDMEVKCLGKATLF